MANYYSPIVIQQKIPISDITSLEILCLTKMFESDERDDEIYFYATESLADVIDVDANELKAALAAPENAEYAKLEQLVEPLRGPGAGDTSVTIDLSLLSWEMFLQNIVKRSLTVKYVSAMISFCCSKMTVDGFGGMAVLITADKIYAKDTNEILAEMFESAGVILD